MWEGGRVKSLVLHLDEPILGKADREEGLTLLLEYFKCNLR